ncbi:MAG: O-methyltransferase [Bacteroidota bacterium]|nr:O-methyltransferase [Bacteroidota bacterium]
MNFLNQELEEYILEHTTSESNILQEINRNTWAKVMQPRMLSGHLQGRILAMFSKLIQSKNILEIGTYTGYSALCLSEGLSTSGKIHTIEINEEYHEIAKSYFETSKYNKQIVQYLGNALDIIPSIDCTFELVFIDADKENYLNYFSLIFDKLNIGGYIIADNVLWSGKVINKEKDEETTALDKYNKMISNNPNLENILLPVRDGLMICKKISDSKSK